MSRRTSTLLSLIAALVSQNLPAAPPQSSTPHSRLARVESSSLHFPSAPVGQEELPPPLYSDPSSGPALWPSYRPLPAGPSPLLPPQVPTHREFAASFQPVPGNYEVVLLHPHTRCPVKVCFSLPAACLKKMHVDRNELEFDYGKVEVELNFKRSGRVEVEYND